MTRIDRSSRKLASTMTSFYVTGSKGNVKTGAYRCKRAVSLPFFSLTQSTMWTQSVAKSERLENVWCDRSARCFLAGWHERTEIPVLLFEKFQALNRYNVDKLFGHTDLDAPISAPTPLLAHACAPGTRIHIQTTHLRSEDPRGSSWAGKATAVEIALSPAACGQDLGHALSTRQTFTFFLRSLSSRVMPHRVSASTTTRRDVTHARTLCTLLSSFSRSPLRLTWRRIAFGRARVLRLRGILRCLSMTRVGIELWNNGDFAYGETDFEY